MGQGKSKKGEEVVAQPTPALSKEELEFVKKSCDTYFKDKKIEKSDDFLFDDFYHAIFEIIEKLSEEKGSMQFKLPSKEKLQAEFNRYRGSGGYFEKPLTKDEIEKIITAVVGLDSFYIGQGASNALLFIFGAPVCAFLLKRFIPGLKSISDDIVIPAATSGSVIVLAMTNKL